MSDPWWSTAELQAGGSQPQVAVPAGWAAQAWGSRSIPEKLLPVTGGPVLPPKQGHFAPG